ncbi:hypothetical protein Dda_3471 [Drechslerella dactyloides]|uniref:Uncharacterized protein n=1 Tax=Drechslerella dactyloides TaxID=74499 RepID=A0AAD6NLA0_DREDA|nr:hypothetical protein Dda_3471 [Drechslerella dactyloides]
MITTDLDRGPRFKAGGRTASSQRGRPKRAIVTRVRANEGKLANHREQPNPIDVDAPRWKQKTQTQSHLSGSGGCCRDNLVSTADPPIERSMDSSWQPVRETCASQLTS